MSRKSTKENKNIFMISREAAGLTREKASEALGFISEDRIYRIENGVVPKPDEVLQMAKCYQDPTLCNSYCTTECQIGQEYIPKHQRKGLSQITVEILAELNELEKSKDRLLEIAFDEAVTDDEILDFGSIQATLDKMSITINSLRLWADQHATKFSL